MKEEQQVSMPSEPLSGSTPSVKLTAAERVGGGSVETEAPKQSAAEDAVHQADHGRKAGLEETQGPVLSSDNVKLSGETAGTGGIEKIWAHRDEDGSTRFRISGELKPPLDRKEAAPNFNTFGSSGNEIGLPDYEKAHLWGPGFGDEARDGIMYAPRSVNQELQNHGVEDRLRELAEVARSQNATIELTAAAESHPQAAGHGKSWSGQDLLKEASYDFHAKLPEGSRQHIGRVEIFVPPPNSPNKPSVEVYGGSAQVWSLT